MNTMLERLETFADHGGASMQEAQELASDAALELKRLLDIIKESCNGDVIAKSEDAALA